MKKSVFFGQVVSGVMILIGMRCYIHFNSDFIVSFISAGVFILGLHLFIDFHNEWFPMTKDKTKTKKEVMEDLEDDFKKWADYE